MKRKIIGVTVGTPTSPKKIENEINPVKTVNGNVPDKNGNVEIGAPIVVGSVEPSIPCLWFNTNITEVGTLNLTRNAEGNEVTVKIGDETYGVEDAGVNNSEQTYNFEII